MKTTFTKARTALAMCVLLFSAALVAPAVSAQTDEPPPLSEQEFQPTIEHHISPPSCTIIAAADRNECIEQGERWRCPLRLSAAAVHRGPLTYNETLIDPVPATRWSHCKFIDLETAVPAVATDRDRPIIDCVETYVNGSVVIGRCQTLPPPLPAPPVEEPAPPVEEPAPPVAAPVPAPVPRFTG